MDELNLWDRQPWDTPTSYTNFERFYLFQERPRQLIKAYKNYQRSKGNDSARYRQAPGSWLNWYYGRDSKGNPIADARTWEERAAAYDRYITAVTIEEDKREAQKIRRAYQKTMKEAQKKIDAAIAAIKPAELTPHETARLLGVVASVTLDVFDINPPDRQLEGDDREGFDLENWAARRAAQAADLGINLYDEEDQESQA